MSFNDPIKEIGANKGPIRGTEIAGAQFAAEASKPQAVAPPPAEAKGTDQTDKVAISDEAKEISAQTPQSTQKVEGAPQGGESKMMEAQKSLDATLTELQGKQEGQKQGEQ